MTGFVDSLLTLADRALRTLSVNARPQRAYPGTRADAPLSVAQRQSAAALMRVNHAGEICAQALYESQAAGTDDPKLRQMFLTAAEEERDHLAWTAQRIQELGGRTSALAPLWYAGSFAIGLAVARLGDAVSLGFMAETERQVEAHLQSHLTQLPAEDVVSREVVQQMQADEVAHGQTATALGGTAIPPVGQALMRAVAKAMTTVAYRI